MIPLREYPLQDVLRMQRQGTKDFRTKSLAQCYRGLF